LVVLVGLAIDQIAQSGLSSLSVIYYSAQLFSSSTDNGGNCSMIVFNVILIYSKIFFKCPNYKGYR
ncbi:hypothetical protein, partial [Klebsiella pneumoniae]|uniref:hypothetical protein n=1 Tax=Klebsiella pneumoniae TaxID=573 RepID=UPI001C6FADC1